MVDAACEPNSGQGYAVAAGAALLERNPGHIDVEILQIGRMRKIEIVGRVLRQRRNRNEERAIVAVSGVVMVDRCELSRRTTIPFLDLAEERDKVAVAHHLATGRTIEESCRQHRHQTPHVGVAANGRRLADRQQ